MDVEGQKAGEPTPRVVISRCIEHENCRWNGLTIRSDAVKIMKPFVEFTPVCPEMEIGLGCPREPVRIVRQGEKQKLVQPKTGRDCTTEMEGFTKKFLDSVEGKVDGFVLKSRSPSCGTHDVKHYPSAEARGGSGKGPGLFGGVVIQHFTSLPVEEEGRLRNYSLREQLFTRLWALARFRMTRRKRSMGALVDFHSRHKLLLQACSESRLRQLGRVVANHERNRLPKVLSDYESLLLAALTKAATTKTNINVLTHAMGHFKDKASAVERRFFLNELDQYRKGRIPLSAPVSVIRAWIVRFGESYLPDQTYFDPYPADLVSVSDSGTGRRLR